MGNKASLNQKNIESYKIKIIKTSYNSKKLNYLVKCIINLI